MRRLDQDRLHATAALLEQEVHEHADVAKGEHTVRQVLQWGTEDSKADQALRDLMVPRVTRIFGIASSADLEARNEQVANGIHAWADGFLIGLRYARQEAQRDANRPTIPPTF